MIDIIMGCHKAEIWNPCSILTWPHCEESLKCDYIENVCCRKLVYITTEFYLIALSRSEIQSFMLVTLKGLSKFIRSFKHELY